MRRPRDRCVYQTSNHQTKVKGSEIIFGGYRYLRGGFATYAHYTLSTLNSAPYPARGAVTLNPESGFGAQGPAHHPVCGAVSKHRGISGLIVSTRQILFASSSLRRHLAAHHQASGYDSTLASNSTLQTLQTLANFHGDAQMLRVCPVFFRAGPKVTFSGDAQTPFVHSIPKTSGDACHCSRGIRNTLNSKPSR